MTWSIQYLPEARKEFRALAGNQRILVEKALRKVRQNPLPAQEGGYGKLLGNKGGNSLTGLQKVKLRDAGLRIVYKVIRTETQMLVVVIGARAGEEVYDVALHRIKK